MKSLTKTEIRWIVSALNQHADTCEKEANKLNGMLKGIIIKTGENDRYTASKLMDMLKSGAKRIEIK